jgi:hypothetical protein
VTNPTVAAYTAVSGLDPSATHTVSIVRLTEVRTKEGIKRKREKEGYKEIQKETELNLS